MSDLENRVRFTWQLVSQFVSWEFCRYMCEQNDNHVPETDVLTFLRNMIVQRTEKSMSEITKHEIVAKFIMETKEIKDIYRMQCIIPLSESVKKIVPELEPAVSKLVHHLETFLNALDCDEDRRELIHVRIEDAIKDFIKEANKFLTQPHLIQIVEPWNAHQQYSHPKPIKKVVYNSKLFEKVLECLHFESITQSEAKLIAVSLYEDKVFEKFLRTAEAEPETEADSEQFSLQSSQANENIYSQEFAKNSQACRTIGILQPPNHVPHVSDSLQLDSPPVVSNEFPIPDASEFRPNIQPSVSGFETNNQPPHPMPTVPPSPLSSPVYPFIHKDISELNGFPEDNDVRNNDNRSHMQFAQSSANESLSSDDYNSKEERVTRKSRHIYENERNPLEQLQNASEPDTSDCEKNEQIRFLTPTLYKKHNKKKEPPKSQVVWLSDAESCNSTVLTNPVDSQKDDPNWTESTCSLYPANWTKKRNRKKPVPTKKKKKPPPRQLDSDSSEDIPICSLTSVVPSPQPVPSTSFAPQPGPSRSVAPQPGPSRSVAPQPRPTSFALHPRTSTSVVHTSSEDERPTKKSRVDQRAKLYRSPNMSIQDFVNQIRRPTPVILSEVPIHKKVNTRPGRNPPAQSGKNSHKKQKCKQCPKSFQTAIALRRHIFLKHTDFAEDSDDSDS